MKQANPGLNFTKVSLAMCLEGITRIYLRKETPFMSNITIREAKKNKLITNLIVHRMIWMTSRKISSQFMLKKELDIVR
jgi:hypothetical protein